MSFLITTGTIPVDEVKLIELVRDRPVLWDGNKKGGRFKQICHDAWEDIVKAMYPNNYEDMNQKDKNNAKILLKKKWNTLRDVWHRKYMKEQGNGRRDNKKKSLPPRRDMDFLRPIYDKKTGTAMTTIQLGPYNRNMEVDADAETQINYNTRKRDKLGENSGGNTPVRQNMSESRLSMISSGAGPVNVISLNKMMSSQNTHPDGDLHGSTSGENQHGGSEDPRPDTSLQNSWSTHHSTDNKTIVQVRLKAVTSAMADYSAKEELIDKPSTSVKCQFITPKSEPIDPPKKLVGKVLPCSDDEEHDVIEVLDDSDSEEYESSVSHRVTTTSTYPGTPMGMDPKENEELWMQYFRTLLPYTMGFNTQVGLEFKVNCMQLLLSLHSAENSSQ